MSVKNSFWLDFFLLVGFLLSFEPHFTGLPPHEWFTIAGMIVILTHILNHWNSLLSTFSHFFHGVNNRARLNYILIAFVFFCFVLSITSGLMISESVLPALGIRFIPNIFWRRIHTLASNLTLLLVSVHFALHWDWVKQTFVRLMQEPFQRQT